MLARLSFVLASTCLVSVASAVTFSQTDWPDLGDLSLTLSSGPGCGATWTATPTGGNPDSYLRIDQNIPASTTVVWNFATAIRNSWTYDPGVSGAISGIDYSGDVQNSLFSNANFYLEITQGGNIFYTSGSSTANSSVWANSSATGAVDTSFILLNADGTANLAVHPDFSATGAVLNFGYGVGFGSVGGGATSTQKIDNVNITVNSAPEPCSVLALGGFAGLILLRRAKRS